MASEDKSEGKLGPPDLPMTSFQWGAVLSAVKDQIPSMDSDISMSDGDEDGGLFIFQREQSNLIPDLSEELEDFPVDKTDLQNTFAFMRHPQEPWNEGLDSSTFQGEKSVLQPGLRGCTLLDTDGLGIQEPSSEQGTTSLELTQDKHGAEEDISGIFGEKEPLAKKREETWASTADTLPLAEGLPFLSEKEKQSEINCKKEGRELTETKFFTKMTLDYPQQNNNNDKIERVAKGESEQRAISAEHPRQFTLFAFEDIQKWDLDKVLQDLELQSDTRRSPTAEATFPSMDHETSRAESQMKLMGRLEELCLKQSRAFFMHRRRRLAKFPDFNGCQGDGKDVPILVPLTNGGSWTPMESQYTPEAPTVYIDLRDAESQTCELLADETQSSSDSSADSEEDAKVMDQAEERMEEFSQRSCKDCTGKSFLLQQLRCFRQRTSQTSAKGCETITQDEGREQDRKTMEETSLPKVRKRWCLKRRGQVSLGPIHSDSLARHFPSLGHLKSTISSSRELEKETGKGPHSEVPQAALEDKGTDFPRAEENERKRQVQENQRWQRLHNQLERSKPQLSLPGKQPTAEQMAHLVPRNTGTSGKHHVIRKPL